jgi:pSer/pThr/pTyr-binding forkhead associated (FHA) protein
MARLQIHDGTQQRTVELTDAVTVLGRAPDNKVPIDDKQASRKHCQVEKTDLGYKVVDLESRNGTRVNDRQVNQALLKPGDRIQIGKHTITFEDPAYKEPPADRLPAPEPPRVAAVPEPPKPAATDPGERNTRRRSGHTTAIQKIARAETRKEQQTLTLVAVGAGVFVFILVVLLAFSGGSGEPQGSRKSQDLFAQARQLAAARQFDRATALLIKITPDQKPLYTQAQALLRQIENQVAADAAPSSDAERKDFDELYDFAEKHRSNPGAYERMASLCEEFRKKYPRSVNLPRVDEYHKIAVEGRKASRRGDLMDSEKAAGEDVKRQDFASALKRVKALIQRYNDEPEIRERLVKLQDEIADKAKVFFTVKKAEAEDLKLRTRKDDARALYQALIVSLGDGNVPEFEDYCKIARTLLEAVQ